MNPDRKTVDDFFRRHGFNIIPEAPPTTSNDRELRQYRHQIGATRDSDRLPTGAAFMLILVAALALWAIIWTLMAAIVSAWVQPWL